MASEQPIISVSGLRGIIGVSLTPELVMRYVAAFAAEIPFIDAAQWGMTGTLIVLQPGKTPSLDDLYPEPPPFEELFPVVGAISCATGSLAALEAIKILSGAGTPLVGKMLIYDGFHGRSNIVELGTGK